MDSRLTPANERVAHVSLRGHVDAVAFVTGDAMSVSAPLADLLTAATGPRTRQLLLGDRVLVLERRDGMAFVRADKDGYCGYVREAALGGTVETTHWVSAPATHVYSGPSIKSPETALLSLGSRLRIVGQAGKLSETAEGQFVPTTHLRAIGDWATDPAGIAESLIGTPYLWGGNSRSGIDCSGLVQAALLACGIACPGDSDLQEQALGQAVPPDGPFQRGDLFFWRGHAAIALDPEWLIHANGFRMAVTREGIAETVARVKQQEGSPLRSVKRL